MHIHTIIHSSITMQLLINSFISHNIPLYFFKPKSKLFFFVNIFFDKFNILCKFLQYARNFQNWIGLMASFVAFFKLKNPLQRLNPYCRHIRTHIHAYKCACAFQIYISVLKISFSRYSFFSHPQELQIYNNTFPDLNNMRQLVSIHKSRSWKNKIKIL